MFPCPKAIEANYHFVFLFLEHYYVGLVLSRQEDNPMQDKVYAFYKEKNRDKGLDSEMWLPFVTQVCMVRPEKLIIRIY